MHFRMRMFMWYKHCFVLNRFLGQDFNVIFHNVLSLYCYNEPTCLYADSWMLLLIVESANTNVYIFGLNRLGIDPTILTLDNHVITRIQSLWWKQLSNVMLTKFLNLSVQGTYQVVTIITNAWDIIINKKYIIRLLTQDFSSL